MEQFINRIKINLKKTLPGTNVQHQMAPMNRGKYDPGNIDNIEYKNSAVMIAICIDENENLFIPLIQRYTYNGFHSGQISLPGGKFDEGDLNYTNTALRECYEEIGIEINTIQVLGNITPLYIPVSKFMVHPIIGFCNKTHIAFKKNEREVKGILKFLLVDLINENNSKIGLVEIEKTEKIKAPYFEIENLKVWGATAMILNEFKSIYLRSLS